MKVLDIKIKIDKLPDGCNSINESCIFNCWKYCVLKMALEQEDAYVQNNREIIPEDCPLRNEANNENIC